MAVGTDHVALLDLCEDRRESDVRSLIDRELFLATTMIELHYEEWVAAATVSARNVFEMLNHSPVAGFAGSALRD